MSKTVLIYGKDDCPYTSGAKDDFSRKNIQFDYFDVKHDPAAMEQMLEFSGGRRDVPVIVVEGKVTIGFGGT